jgi:hypothetical protein
MKITDRYISLLMLLLATCTVYAHKTTSSGSREQHQQLTCPCQVYQRPDLSDKELTARWMVHSLDWGVVSTISCRHRSNNNTVMPFGNVYSFVDGPCATATGTPYFYGTYMDQTFQDIQQNSVASFTLSQASFASVCGGGGQLAQCDITHLSKKKFTGDPENPVCARLTLSGNLVEVSSASDEFKMAYKAFVHRHLNMKTWPEDHNWKILKLEINDIWLIDYFGGASILNVNDYYNAKLIDVEARDDE